MVSEYHHYRRVEFSDTDMAGIMHFSRFFIFMESAEHAFFRELGFSIHTQIEGRRFGWPRVNAECQYKKPLRFEDEIDIHLRVAEINEKTIRYLFSFYKRNDDRREPAAQGSLVVVCVVKDDEDQTFRSAPIPDEIRRKIEVHPARMEP